MSQVITHVVIILEDRVRLKYLTRSLLNKLKNAGFQVEPDGHGNPSVKFNTEDEKSLESIFIWLAQNGVAFQADPKDIASPASIMHRLKESKIYNGAYKECSFNGNWVYTEK
jgi:hypothetical protein